MSGSPNTFFFYLFNILIIIEINKTNLIMRSQNLEMTLKLKKIKYY